jgi:RHS repeat-associated protein
MACARNPSPIRSPIPGQIRCPSQSLKPYNRSHMQPALRSSIPDASLAVFPVNGENSHQGLTSRNPALYPVREVCNFTVLLGLQSTAVLNRVGPRSPGKERDTESGNDYFMARYYSSAMGRFLSPDWAAKEEPVPYATFDDPQSLNLYSYVRNNPLSRADADGHCGEDLCIVEGGVTAYFVGAAAVAGTAALLSTPAAQRSLSTFTSAASENFSSNVSALKSTVSGWFSSKSSAPAASSDKPSTLAPGPHAGDGTPARSGDRNFTPGERGAVNAEGAEKGCHTCGTTDPGTKSGNFIPDHQPPTALNPAGGEQTLYPHCLSCSRTQGGEVNAAKQQAPQPPPPPKPQPQQ